MVAEDAQGRPLLPRTRKTRAILAILALSAPRPVMRLQLVGLLWSRRGTEQGRASLRQAIHELQDGFGTRFASLLTVDRNYLALKTDDVWVDAQHAVLASPSQPDVLSLFQRPLLEDLVGLDPAFDQWLDVERTRILRVARVIGEGVLTACSDPVQQIAAARQLLTIDPGHEGAWRAIIRSEVEQGDRMAALAAYEQCCSALAERALGQPSAETEELVLRVRGLHAPEERSVSDAWDTASVVPSRRLSPIEPTGLRLGVTTPRTIGAAPADELATGLAEEIITGLSRFRWISCIPASGSDVLVGERPPGARPRRRPNFDFLLDGTIQRSDDRIRIMVRLHDMRAAGAVMWARRFDHPLADTLTVQENLAAAIVAQLDPELLIHEAERSAARNHADPSAHELVLRAIPSIYRLERGGFQAAGELLEAAIGGNPRSSVAHAWYAYWHLFLVGQGWAPDPIAASARAVDLAERAVTLDPGDARALTLAGHVRGFLGRRPEEATILHDRALALNPNLALAWCFSGLSSAYRGDLDDAEMRMLRATRLSPSDPHLFFFDMALTMPYFLRGDYARAVEIGRRAIELNPGFSSAYKGQLAALGHLGRSRETGDVLSRLLAIEPRFSVKGAMERSPLQRPGDLARYKEGLLLAGAPKE